MRRALLVLALSACGTDDTVYTDVTIIRGEGDAWLDLTITGAEVAAPEGAAVIIQVGMPDRPPERLGLATTTVANRTFAVHFPDVWELGLYKKKTILFDLDDSGTCTDGDTLLADYSAAVEDTSLTSAQFFPGECADFVASWPSE